MTLPPRRIGIDISKAWLDVFDTGTGKLSRVHNSPADIAALLARVPATSRIIFEATAPYDCELRRAITAVGRQAIRVNPSRARDFARASGFLAKTDAVDARMLACLPDALNLPETPDFDPERETLAALHRRRDQLVDTRAVERGRCVDEPDADARESLARHIFWLDGEIKALDAAIAVQLQKPKIAPTVALLRSVKGVGDVTIATLMALLPELGKRSAKSIAALAGLAPLNRDSGMTRGQRHIGGGRTRVRRALYMAALVATRFEPRFNAYYTALKERCGNAKVAIVAVARKLLVTLNAMVKTRQHFRA